MQVGVAEMSVLVVAGDRPRAREVAATFEAREGGDAATAAGVQEGLERLETTEFDAVVLDVPDASPEEAVARLADATDDQPLVAVLDDVGLDPEAALAAGATDVVNGDPGTATLTNRVELATAAVRAERTAREVRQRYHRLLDASPAAIVIFDGDGELLYANPAAASLVGADDPHDVAGMNLFDFVVDEEADLVRGRIERLLEEDDTVHFEEVPLEGVDGERRFVDGAASPVTVDGEPGGQAVFSDVTSLKRREGRLRTERDRFTALFESLPEPAAHVRFEDGEPVVRNVNTRFEEVFGYDVDTLRGERLDEYLVAEDRDEEATALEAAAVDGDEVEGDVRRRTADGVREFRFSARSVGTADGAQEGVAIYVDITERKERERRLERQNERLDAFASIVSHDLQGPLSVAKGNLYLVREEGDESYLEKVDGALDRMERIIDDLLRLARSGEESIDPEPVDASAVVTAAWEAVDPDGGELRNELDGRIAADRSQFEELLTNLLRNAVEHGGEDVTVTVGELDDDRSGFYVADDGPGIPPEEREDVFEPGFTTDDEGTGFGLVVVDQITRAHGWEATVTESEDGGARFEFTGVERP